MPATEYHWMITITWQPRPGVVSNYSADGTIPVRPGATRAQVFDGLLRHAKQNAGTTRANVLHFSLEPNRLTPHTPHTPTTTDLTGQQLPDER